MKIRTIGAIALLSIFLAACGAAPAASPTAAPAGSQAATGAAALADLPANANGYVDVTVDQLAGALAQKGFTLVNVHVPYEGELPQTDLFVPYDQIGDSLDQLPAKDAPIVLYCRSGNMSTQAAKTLVGLGYTNIYELNGGFNAWKAAGHELIVHQ